MTKENYFIWYKSAYHQNVEVILKKAKLALKKYKESDDPTHHKCVRRIEYYKYIINKLETPEQQKLF